MLWEAIFSYSITRRHVLYTDKKSLDWSLWLSFYIKSIKTNMPSRDKDIWEKLICAFDTYNLTPEWAIARVVGFYVDFAVWIEQDLNGLLDENILTKK
jgi:hypothetical protein